MKKTLITLLFCYFLFFLNAQSWENPFNDVYQLDSLNVWIVGSNGTIINSKDAGNSWNDYSIDTSIYLKSVCFNTEQNGYIIGESGFIRKTINGGHTWEPLELDSIQSYYSVFFLDENYGWISSGYNGLYKTIDGGHSWSHHSDTIVKVLFFDTLNGYGKTYKNSKHKLVRTEDGGLTWTEVCNLGLSVFGGGDFHFADMSHGVKITNGESILHYSKTSEGGQTWAEIEYDTPNVEFLDSQNAWFGLYNLINYSGDFLETYDSFQLPTVACIYDLSVCGFSNGWAVGHKENWDQGCIWKLVGVNEWVEILPAAINKNLHNSIQLSAYPNPFENTLTIDFELKNTCDVKISIHNNIGQEIQTLFEGRITTGKHQITWDSNELNYGVYFIKLQQDKGISTQKVIKY